MRRLENLHAFDQISHMNAVVLPNYRDRNLLRAEVSIDKSKYGEEIRNEFFRAANKVMAHGKTLRTYLDEQRVDSAALEHLTTQEKNNLLRKWLLANCQNESAPQTIMAADANPLGERSAHALGALSLADQVENIIYYEHNGICQIAYFILVNDFINHLNAFLFLREPAAQLTIPDDSYSINIMNKAGELIIRVQHSMHILISEGLVLDLGMVQSDFFPSDQGFVLKAMAFEDADLVDLLSTPNPDIEYQKIALWLQSLVIKFCRQKTTTPELMVGAYTFAIEYMDFEYEYEDKDRQAQKKSRLDASSLFDALKAQMQCVNSNVDVMLQCFIRQQVKGALPADIPFLFLLKNPALIQPKSGSQNGAAQKLDAAKSTNTVDEAADPNQWMVEAAQCFYRQMYDEILRLHTQMTQQVAPELRLAQFQMLLELAMITGQPMDLTGLNLSGLVLGGLDLSNAKLLGTNLSDAILVGTVLNGAVVGQTTNWYGADLSSVECDAVRYYLPFVDRELMLANGADGFACSPVCVLQNAQMDEDVDSQALLLAFMFDQVDRLLQKPSFKGLALNLSYVLQMQNSQGGQHEAFDLKVFIVEAMKDVLSEEAKVLFDVLHQLAPRTVLQSHLFHSPANGVGAAAAAPPPPSSSFLSENTPGSPVYRN